VSEQPTPPPSSDEEGLEILRAWIQDDTLHCSLLAHAFTEPATWGTVLADLARHAAEAMNEDDGVDTAEALRAIRDAFTAELDPDAQSK
jgi:hypothetical protein